MHVVYLVRHDATGRYYVGKTSKRNPLQRWKDHQWEALYGAQACRWFHRAVCKYGPDAFSFQVVEACDSSDEAFRRESWWISFLRSSVSGHGFNLIEEYSHHVSPETREKIRRAHLGKTLSAETRAKLSAAHRGKRRGPFSPERRKALSEMRKKAYAEGRLKTPSTIGRRMTDEDKANIAAALRGRKWSPEQRAHAAAHPHKHSQESLARMSAAQRGRKHSEETKRKIAEGARRARARRKGEANE